MKFWIYFVCLFPALVLETVLKEVGLWSIVFDFAYNKMNIDGYDAAGISSFSSTAVSLLLYVLAFYLAKKWIAKRETKQMETPREDVPREEEPKQKRSISPVIEFVVIAILLAVLITVMVPLMQTDFAWLTNFLDVFCNIVICVGFVFLLVSVPFCLSGKEIGAILRLSGFGLFVFGLSVFYIFATFHLI